MEWIEPETLSSYPMFTDERVQREHTLDRLIPSKIASVDELVKALSEWGMVVIVIALDRCFLDCPVQWSNWPLVQ